MFKTISLLNCHISSVNIFSLTSSSCKATAVFLGYTSNIGTVNFFLSALPMSVYGVDIQSFCGMEFPNSTKLIKSDLKRALFA